MSLLLSNALLRAFIQSKGWRVPRRGEVFGVGLRGARLTGARSVLAQLTSRGEAGP